MEDTKQHKQDIGGIETADAELANRALYLILDDVVKFHKTLESERLPCVKLSSLLALDLWLTHLGQRIGDHRGYTRSLDSIYDEVLGSHENSTAAIKELIHTCGRRTGHSTDDLEELCGPVLAEVISRFMEQARLKRKIGQKLGRGTISALMRTLEGEVRDDGLLSAERVNIYGRPSFDGGSYGGIGEIYANSTAFAGDPMFADKMRGYEVGIVKDRERRWKAIFRAVLDAATSVPKF